MAIAAIAGYVLAVGWQPSVVRAGVAGGLASLAWLLSRPRDRWHFLALGAAVLLAWTPASLLEPGFQLSFAAVASIFLLLPRLRPALEGYPLPNWLREAIAVSTACGAATAPILWLQFGSVPVYSLPANALVTPAIGPLLGIALVGSLIEPVLPTAALALGWLNGWLAAYIAGCASVIGGLPFSQVGSATAVCLLLGTPVALLALQRLPRWRRPLAITCAAAVMPALLAWQLLPEARLPPPTGLRITFLDVGQGDSILLQVPEGAVLVDQGPPEADVAGQLQGLGVRRLAALVLTHPQRDHIGGAEDTLRRLAVDRVLDPRLAVSGPFERAALAEAADRGVPVVETRAGDGFRLGRLRLRVLWPDGPGTASEDPNLLPIVLLASYGEVDALLTADAETEVTAHLLSRRIEILKVAHHGSADPGLDDELRELRPAVAVISCGRNNEYGHPTPSTLAALRDSPGLQPLPHRRGRTRRARVGRPPDLGAFEALSRLASWPIRPRSSRSICSPAATGPRSRRRSGGFVATSSRRRRRSSALRSSRAATSPPSATPAVSSAMRGSCSSKASTGGATARAGSETAGRRPT